MWHVNPLLGYATEVTQKCWNVTSDTEHAAMTSHSTRNRGIDVYSVPFRAAGGWRPCRAEQSRAVRQRFQGNDL
jgi:hypothetical protein